MYVKDLALWHSIMKSTSSRKTGSRSGIAAAETLLVGDDRRDLEAAIEGEAPQTFDRVLVAVGRRAVTLDHGRVVEVA